jgi:hypothetical protein
MHACMHERKDGGREKKDEHKKRNTKSPKRKLTVSRMMSGRKAVYNT